MKKQILALLTILLTTGFATPSSATEVQGRETGNGGDAIRLDVISVRNYIYENCQHWESLREGGVSPETLREKMEEVGTGRGSLQMEDEIVLEDGVSRSGRNRPWIPDLAFSRVRWQRDFANVDGASALPLKVGIVLHEYLGLLGVEGTDVYTVSHAVVNELRINANALAHGERRDTIQFVIRNFYNSSNSAVAVGQNAAYGILCQRNFFRGATGYLELFPNLTARSFRDSVTKPTVELNYIVTQVAQKSYPSWDACLLDWQRLQSMNPQEQVVVRILSETEFSIATQPSRN